MGIHKRKLRVLVVEDEPKWRNALVDMYDSILNVNDDVYDAENPTSAFKILASRDIDVLSLDINLPTDENGYTYKSLKNKAIEKGGVAIVLVTAKSWDEEVRDSFGEDVDYIEKGLEKRIPDGWIILDKVKGRSVKYNIEVFQERLSRSRLNTLSHKAIPQHRYPHLCLVYELEDRLFEIELYEGKKAIRDDRSDLLGHGSLGSGILLLDSNNANALNSMGLCNKHKYECISQVAARLLDEGNQRYLCKVDYSDDNISLINIENDFQSEDFRPTGTYLDFLHKLAADSIPGTGSTFRIPPDRKWKTQKSRLMANVLSPLGLPDDIIQVEDRGEPSSHYKYQVSISGLDLAVCSHTYAQEKILS